MWFASGTLNVPSGHYPYGIASEDLAGTIHCYKAPAATNSITVLHDGAVFATENLRNGIVRISPGGQMPHRLRD